MLSRTLCVCIACCLAMLGCQRGNSPTSPEAAPAIAGTAYQPLPSEAGPIGPVTDIAQGSTQEALGVFWLERSASDPLTATLRQERVATQQGDVYQLSVRPFLQPQHVKLLSATALGGGLTDYQLQFTHPIPMPDNLQRPATAQKRVDLFLFDLQAVLLVEGEDRFFEDSLQVNTTAVPNADGYRHLLPLVDIGALGIQNGTNLFPYKLFWTRDDSYPQGNYNALTGGWTGASLLDPWGYDVIPQGQTRQVACRVRDDLDGAIALVLTAKYMDPRAGSTVDERIANRLPDPADASKLRYCLPEACGDLQMLTPLGNGPGLRTDSTLAETLLTMQTLDWDSHAEVATSFPDPQDPGKVRQRSDIIAIQASFPDIDPNEPFAGTVKALTGAALQYQQIDIPITNRHRLVTEVPADNAPLTGLVRVIDYQDATPGGEIQLNERQEVMTPAANLNRRYQVLHVNVLPPMTARIAESFACPPGYIFRPTLVVEHGTPTSYTWNFGGGTSPNTSTQAAPSVTVTGSGGVVDCWVDVKLDDYTIHLPFHLERRPPDPVLPATDYEYANLNLPRHFTDIHYPYGPIATSDNTPLDNPVTNAGAKLGRVLFYDIRLSQNYKRSCSSCHVQALAFATNNRFDTGLNGQQLTRNSMGLANCRYYHSGKMFYDERADSLEAQALMPIQDAKEMGLALPELRARLEDTSFYPRLFEEAFGDQEITDERIAKALAQFMRSIVSYRSRFDLAMTAGPNQTPDFEAVFTDQELTGLALFRGYPGQNVPNMRCNQCHDTAIQTMGAAADVASGQLEGPGALNNGLGNPYYEPTTTIDEFKAPSLRNVALTAPYMHDGRFSTLDSVVTFYASGVQAHPNLHHFLRENDLPGNPPERFDITYSRKAALIAFLKTLTDEELLVDPKYSNPFPPL